MGDLSPHFSLFSHFTRDMVDLHIDDSILFVKDLVKGCGVKILSW